MDTVRPVAHVLLVPRVRTASVPQGAPDPRAANSPRASPATPEYLGTEPGRGPRDPPLFGPRLRHPAAKPLPILRSGRGLRGSGVRSTYLFLAHCYPAFSLLAAAEGDVPPRSEPYKNKTKIIWLKKKSSIQMSFFFTLNSSVRGIERVKGIMIVARYHHVNNSDYSVMTIL